MEFILGMFVGETLIILILLFFYGINENNK